MDTAKCWRRLRMALVSTCLLFQSGCLCGCSPGVEVIDAGLLDLERRSAEEVWVYRVHAHQRGDALRVTGRVSPRSTGGCIEVAVRDPAGDTLAEERVPVRRRRWTHRSAGSPDFVATLRARPPKGSRLRIMHRDIVDCTEEENAIDQAR